MQYVQAEQTLKSPNGEWKLFHDAITVDFVPRKGEFWVHPLKEINSGLMNHGSLIEGEIVFVEHFYHSLIEQKQNHFHLWHKIKLLGDDKPMDEERYKRLLKTLKIHEDIYMNDYNFKRLYSRDADYHRTIHLFRR